jgi:hypothetical protein
MIKKYFLLFIISLESLIAKSQHYFEGTITYEFNFKSDKLQDPNKLLIPVLGTDSTLSFRENSY